MATLVIEHHADSAGGRLVTTLRDYGHALDVRRLHRGESLPNDLDDVDGIVSLGGDFAANGSESWIEPELALLRDAHHTQVPVIGICLGSQLLARALGGEISRLEGGAENGWHDVTLNHVGREDPLFKGIPWTSTQFQCHEDFVSTLPADAATLASSERCPVQAWSLGPWTYGVQHHPEYTREQIDAWIAQANDAAARDGVATHFDEFERLGRRFAENVALFLLPIDRRSKGLARDLHH